MKKYFYRFMIWLLEAEHRALKKKEAKLQDDWQRIEMSKRYCIEKLKATEQI